MKSNKKQSLLIVMLICYPVLLISCASTGRRTQLPVAQVKSYSEAMEDNGKQSVSLAMEYYKQGGYEKAGDLLVEAANLFHEGNDLQKERITRLQAGKVNLKYGNRAAFIESMDRVETLITEYEMPSEQERFFLNLAAQMKHQEELPYPVLPKWRSVFK